MAEDKAFKEEKPAEFKFPNKMEPKEIVAPDGHVVLSAEDIKERDAKS